MSFEKLVRSCLYNWLGYGNISAPVWFIGMEEGGAEIWRMGTLSLEESLQKRSKYIPAMDFRTVWEDYYNIPLGSFKGITVWHYMAAFLLGLQGTKATSDQVHQFIFNSKQIGSRSSGHFLCEFLPLPRKSNSSMEGYESVWKSVHEYRNEVMPTRFDLISNALTHNPTVKLLVCYNKAFANEALHHYSSKSKQMWVDQRGKRYELYSLQVTDDRNVHMLVTPFFGQGQSSYEGLFTAATRIQELLQDLSTG